jgi:hypothetical protein
MEFFPQYGGGGAGPLSSSAESGNVFGNPAGREPSLLLVGLVLAAFVLVALALNRK